MSPKAQIWKILAIFWKICFLKRKQEIKFGYLGLRKTFLDIFEKFFLKSAIKSKIWVSRIELLEEEDRGCVTLG